MSPAEKLQHASNTSHPSPDTVAETFGAENTPDDLSEEGADAAAAAVMVMPEEKIFSRHGSGYHQLAALTGRAEFTNPVAQDQAALGNTNAAMVAELGHASTYCHMQFTLNRVPDDSELNFRTYLNRVQAVQAGTEFIATTVTLGLLGGMRQAGGTAATRSFYSVQTTDTALDWVAGTSKWPTSPTRSALGEGIYSFANKADAQAYMTKLTSAGASDLRVLKLTMSEKDFAGLSKLNVDALADPEAWMMQNSKLWGGTPTHGMQYIQRGGANMAEHYFDAPTTGLMDVDF
jgi:hypothetical protein